tara:strand:+ start:559 stop:840 length:282 start_codon:yes stop_codon:yes gene_type:complete
MNDETRKKMKALSTKLKNRELQDPADFKVGALVRWREYISSHKEPYFGILIKRGSDAELGRTKAWRVRWFCGPYDGEEGWASQIDLEVISESG